MKYSLNDYASYMSERCVRIEGFSNTEMAAKLVAVYLLNGFRCVSCCQMFSASSVSIKTTKFKQDFDRYCLRPTKKMQEVFLPLAARNQITGYRQVLCANSFTSLAELSLHRAGKPALNYLVAEDRERVKGGEAACEALDVNSV